MVMSSTRVRALNAQTYIHGCLVLAIVVLIMAANPSLAQTGSCTLDRSGLAFVAAVEGAGVLDTDIAKALVSQKIADGVRTWNHGPVVTWDELQSVTDGTLREMKTLNTWMHIPVEGALRRLLQRTGQSTARAPQVSAYIRPSISRVDGSLRLELRLYCVAASASNGSLLQAAKVISVRGDSTGALLAAASSAAESFKSTDAPPIPRVTGGSIHRVPIGQDVALDATGSSDPDSDDFTFAWSLDDTRVPLRGDGARATFVPTEAKDYNVTLTLRQTVGSGRESTPLAIVIRAYEPLMLRVAEPRIEPLSLGAAPHPGGEVDGERPSRPGSGQEVKLSAECRGCSSSTWSQLEGPTVAIPDACTTPGASSTDRGSQNKATVPVDERDYYRAFSCTITVREPGTYRFRFVGSSDFDTKHEDQAVLVTSPPRARLWGRDAVVAGSVYKLEARSGYDPLSSPLRYRWEASEDPFPEGETAPRDTHPNGVLIESPTSADTNIVIVDPNRSIYFRTCLTALRSFNGRTLSDTGCESHVVRSKNPAFLPFLAAGSDFSLEPGPVWEGIRTRVGIAVRWPWEALGIRFVQNVLSNDRDDSRLSLGSGTELGAVVLASPVFQPFLSCYGTWSSKSWGPRVGIDVRIRTYLLVSSYFWLEPSNGWSAHAGAAFGASLPFETL
jgi:hypothetical protein